MPQETKTIDQYTREELLADITFVSCEYAETAEQLAGLVSELEKPCTGQRLMAIKQEYCDLVPYCP